MIRRITKQCGQFAPGVVHDWPLTTWNQLANDAGFTKGRGKNQKPDLEAFSQAEQGEVQIGGRDGVAAGAAA